MRLSVTMQDGTVKDYEDDDSYEYKWQVGVAGELIIYRAKMESATFKVKGEPQVWTVWASGMWNKVVDNPSEE